MGFKDVNKYLLEKDDFYKQNEYEEKQKMKLEDVKTAIEHQ